MFSLPIVIVVIGTKMGGIGADPWVRSLLSLWVIDENNVHLLSF